MICPTLCLKKCPMKLSNFLVARKRILSMLQVKLDKESKKYYEPLSNAFPLPRVTPMLLCRRSFLTLYSIHSEALLLTSKLLMAQFIRTKTYSSLTRRNIMTLMRLECLKWTYHHASNLHAEM